MLPKVSLLDYLILFVLFKKFKMQFKDKLQMASMAGDELQNILQLLTNRSWSVWRSDEVSGQCVVVLR